MAKKIVLVERMELRKTRRNDNYGDLTVNLGSGGEFASINAKLWQCDKFIAQNRALPASGDIIEADYKADEYNGMPQWSINDWRALSGADAEAAREIFVQPDRIARDYYLALLESLIEQTDPEHVCGEILREVFDDVGFREGFYRAPAAKARHQNYPGGLLEHTLNVTSVALAIADVYGANGTAGLSFNQETAPIDRTLLIAAGLLHDIGKMHTYKMNPMPDYTESDFFEGHLPMSYAIVRELAGPLREAPPYDGAVTQIDKLLHCILSHHGELEFGSPVTPACVEAYLLSQADVTDARMAEIASEGHAALRQNPEARWARVHQFRRGVFIGDWPKP